MALALGLALGAPAAALAAPAQGAFSLLDEPADGPDARRYKAALRLFAGARTVLIICDSCKSEAAWNRYEKRNGNTLGFVAKQFKLGGGFGEAQKRAVDVFSVEAANAELAANSCPELVAGIDSQDWDLYKGDRFHSDYEFLRSARE
jgi:hypothetical protein